MAVERSELRLVWPPALFAAEARALLGRAADDDSLGGLLSEAFHGGRGQKLLQQTAASFPQTALTQATDEAESNAWGATTASLARLAYPRRPTARLVEALADAAGSLPRHRPRQLFWQRQQAPVNSLLGIAATKEQFAGLVGELVALGYFEDAFGSDCPDRSEDPDGQGQRWLALRLDLPSTPLWPLHTWADTGPVPSGVHERWLPEVFLDVVEALDEVVARPRERRWHDFHQDWDYADYSRPAGHAVYRWRVNELLGRTSFSLRLARVGEDAGLLVHATDGARQDLIEQALQTPQVHDRAGVAHALALFRARGASREDKRSAVVALARLLEDRRQLLKQELLSKDERALFAVANEFDLRH